MATVNALAEQQLVASIQECLSLFQYDTAKFLGERLVALSNNEFNQQLLATCYIHANQSYRAYHMLKGHTSHRSRYLLAIACVNMSRYSEAKEALLKMGDAEIPFGAAGLDLLGKVCRLTSSHTDARDYYYRALRLNPLLWSAYEELCAVGGDEEAADLCSSALSPLRCNAEGEGGGPSPSTSSQVSSALAHTPQHSQGHSQGHGHHRGPQQQGGHGHHRGHGHSKDHGRTPAQQHRPGGPPGTSGGMGYGFRFGGGGNGGGGGGTRPEPGSIFGTGPAGTSAVGPVAGTGAGGYGGPPASAAGVLFQTPVQGSGGLFASPIPMFAGFGTGMQTGGTAPAATGGLGSVFGWGQAAVADASGGEVGGGGEPPSTGPQFFRFGALGGAGTAAGAGGGGGGGAMAFATPPVAGPAAHVPAPPQKQLPMAGPSEVPFPGFAAGPAGTGPNGAVGPTASGAAGAGAGAGGYPHRISRMVDEGKVRKVSNKLFSDPRSSVRRSQRLAALNTAAAAAMSGGHGGGGGGGPSGGGGGGGLFTPYGPATSVQGQAKSGQASYVEGDSQNTPDPRDPPPAPVQQQLHPDAKLGRQPGHGQGQGQGHAGPPGAAAAAAAAAGGGMPQQLFTAFGARPGAAQAAAGPGGAPGRGASGSAEGRAAVLQLLAPLLEAVRHLAAYRCTEAIAALKKLPMAQYRTAWVYCALGRAYFESINYQQAAQHFETARQLDRCRVEDMEVYSTVLWHTKRDYELSHLAQEMAATDRLAPQTWCVVGNLFSGQKDHEAAIDFFLRAVQVDPTFTYAYTLAAHEYFANADYDKATTAYRAALKLDPRHYNALYGLGQVCYRQEKYQDALNNFRAASAIAPRSSVLCCYVGMSAAKLHQHHLALDKLQESVELDPHNPLARYERAAVLASMDRLMEALAELEALQRVAPGEASVAFQKGKLYKRLNNLTAAQQSYQEALSYGGGSSADAALIKAAIERLGLSEDEEEEEM